jgi:DNA-binding beta-propeller fold protein YncE
VSETGSGGECRDGRALQGSQSLAISPDGANVYAAASANDAIVLFSRNRSSGALTQLAGRAGCVSEAGGACADGVGLAGVSSIAVSPDGRNAYATGYFTHTVAVFARAAADPQAVRLTARLRPVLRGPAASGRAELTLQPTLRRLCWTLVHRGVGRVTGARLRLSGRAQVVARFGRGASARGCTTVPARWVGRLARRPADFVVDVQSASYPNGALRGRLAKRPA